MSPAVGVSTELNINEVHAAPYVWSLENATIPVGTNYYNIGRVIGAGRVDAYRIRVSGGTVTSVIVQGRGSVNDAWATVATVADDTYSDEDVIKTDYRVEIIIATSPVVLDVVVKFNELEAV